MSGRWAGQWRRARTAAVALRGAVGPGRWRARGGHGPREQHYEAGVQPAAQGAEPAGGRRRPGGGAGELRAHPGAGGMGDADGEEGKMPAEGAGPGWARSDGNSPRGAWSGYSWARLCRAGGVIPSGRRFCEWARSAQVSGGRGQLELPRLGFVQWAGLELVGGAWVGGRGLPGRAGLAPLGGAGTGRWRWTGRAWPHPPKEGRGATGIGLTLPWRSARGHQGAVAPGVPQPSNGCSTWSSHQWG